MGMQQHAWEQGWSGPGREGRHNATLLVTSAFVALWAGTLMLRLYRWAALRFLHSASQVRFPLPTF